jgi:carbon monoxide dehydrogenase subunit G
MASQDVVFFVPKPIDEVWPLLADRHSMGSLFPGFKAVKILNEEDSVWTVQFSFGPFSRIVDIHTHNTDLREREVIAWTSKAEGFSGGGRIGLRPAGEGTEVSVRMEIHSFGPLPFFQNIVVAERLGAITREFVRNIRDRLAGPSRS